MMNESVMKIQNSLSNYEKSNSLIYNGNKTNSELVNINNCEDMNFNEELEDVQSKNTSSFLETGATAVVGLTSIVSGIADLGESVIDGLIWAGGTVASGVLSLLGKDELSEQVKEGTKSFISVDAVSQINEEFYENTDIGRKINELSNMKYDSEKAKKISDISEKVGEFAAATIVTIATGALGPLLVIGIGALKGFGESAESRYSDINNDSYDTGAILLDGIGTGFNWYSM